MATPARLSIGRGQANDVVVDHPSVSRNHAEMQRNDDGSFDIFDHKSSVGTFALHEGRWVQFEHATVGPDETIRLGEFETTPKMLMAAYCDPFDRTTERGPKPIETRREANRQLGSEGPAGTPNPQPPPGALQADAFRPPETSLPAPRRGAAPAPTIPEAPPMPAPTTASEPVAPSDTLARPSAGATLRKGSRSLVVAYLLWFFLGGFGAHRFYLGADITGAVQAIFLLAGVGLMLMGQGSAGWFIGTVPLTLLALWWLVDAFLTNDMVKKRNAPPPS